MTSACQPAAGITLTFIEKSGLLETAENLGLLSAAVDRCTCCCDMQLFTPDTSRCHQTCLSVMQLTAYECRVHHPQEHTWQALCCGLCAVCSGACCRVSSAGQQQWLDCRPGQRLAAWLHTSVPTSLKLVCCIVHDHVLSHVQVALVALGALGGSAAFAGGQLLSTLQKEVA